MGWIAIHHGEVPQCQHNALCSSIFFARRWCFRMQCVRQLKKSTELEKLKDHLRDLCLFSLTLAFFCFGHLSSSCFCSCWSHNAGVWSAVSVSRVLSPADESFDKASCGLVLGPQFAPVKKCYIASRMHRASHLSKDQRVYHQRCTDLSLGLPWLLGSEISLAKLLLPFGVQLPPVLNEYFA